MGLYVITPKAVTPGFELGSYPVAGYALTTELYDCCSLDAWADTNTVICAQIYEPSVLKSHTQNHSDVI